jgi:uncharacterized membrane protein
MKKYYLSKAYLTYLGFLAFGFSMTLLFVWASSGKFNTALKDVIPIYFLVAISPLALKKIEADQAFEEKMDLFLSTVKLNEDEKFLEECWEKEFDASNGELR